MPSKQCMLNISGSQLCAPFLKDPGDCCFFLLRRGGGKILAVQCGGGRREALPLLALSCPTLAWLERQQQLL